MHTVGVTFLATNDLPATELNKPFQRTMNTPGSIPGFLFYPHVGQVDDRRAATTPRAPATRRAAQTDLRRAGPAHARARGRRLRPHDRLDARQARVPPAGDRRRTHACLMQFYQAGRSEGGSFDDGIEAALQRILADPEFIYRGEREPASAGRRPSLSHHRPRAGVAAVVLPLEQHSGRPADRPRGAGHAARSGGARAAGAPHARRPARPRRWSRNFTGQWLERRGRSRTSEPVVNLFPDFDDNLRDAYQREVELFFASVVQEDRSILDLLTANYTFVNERLAKHYGIPNIYGPQFRRVTLPPELDVRRGLLGKGALLTVTSNPARTSPVTRGKWFQQTFLGVDAAGSAAGRRGPSSAKPTDTTGNAKAPTMREALEKHRVEPELLVVPPDLRADRHRARELRRGRRLAHARRRRADRRERRAARRHASSTVRSACATLMSPLRRSVRARRRREAADLRARPRRRVTTTCRWCARSCATAAKPGTIDSRRSSWASSRATPFQMNQKAAVRPRPRSGAAQLNRSSPSSCFSPRSTSPGGRSCAVPAPRWRCRCSKRWCRRATALAQTAASAEAALRRPVRAARRWRPATGCPRRKARCRPSCRSTGSRSSRSAIRR